MSTCSKWVVELDWKKRGKQLIPRSKKVIILVPNTKVQSPNLRPTYRVGAVTCKVTYLILGREPQTSLTVKWRIWSDTLGQTSTIAVNHPSWPITLLTYLIQICQNYPWHMHRASQKRTCIWPTSKIRALPKLFSRNWGRIISTKQTCTRSTTLL